MDWVSPVLGAGATIASALIGGSSKDNSLAGSYIPPNYNKVTWKDGRLAYYDPTTNETFDYMDNATKSKIPKSVYWSIMMNQANQMFSEKMWNAQNEYNTPFNQAQRLKAAGLNPYLAMQNDGSIGMAESASTPSGSADMSSGSVDASLAASRSQLIGSMGNTLQSAFSNINQQKIASAQADKLQSETDYQNIVNKFAITDMITKLQQRMVETHDTESRKRYQDIINYVTDSSKEYLVEKNHSDAVNSLNSTLLQEDEHNLNAARLRAQKLEGDLLSVNLSWLPKEKAAGIAQAYAQAYASTASAKASEQAALNYAADTYGKQFDNKMRDDLRTVIEKSERSRYASQGTSLDILKEQLREAKKNNNTYEIRLIGDMIGKITGGFQNYAVGKHMLK